MGFYKVPLRLESLKEVVRQILMAWTTIKWEIAMHARTQIKELIFNVRSLTKLQLWHPKTWVLSHSLATWPWTSHFSSLCLFPHKCREIHHNGHVQPCFFSPCSCFSATKSCLTLCHPMDCSTPGSSVLDCFPEFAQIHTHWVSDTI